MSIMNTDPPKEGKLKVVCEIPLSILDDLLSDVDTANRSANTADLLYVIDLDRWEIYNDNTHETETEKGINSAIIWAKSNGYDGVYLKAGTYLLEPTYHDNGDPNKGASAGVNKFTASLRGIKLVSNFIFEMSPNTIIQIKTNNAHMYTAILAYQVDNVIIRGGQVIGDMDTHLWTTYTNYGTGGHGYGLFMQQVNNVKVYDTKFSKCQGDGVITFDTLDEAYMSSNIYMKNVICDSNMRQGMSVVGGDNMLFEDCTFSGSSGGSPEFGFDIESGSHSSTNIKFRNCLFTNNASGGLCNYDGANPIIENCTFTQRLLYMPGFGAEIRNCTFTNQDQTYYKKYPTHLTVNTAYVIGDGARIDSSISSEGYTCIKSGTTYGSMSRKNNYPPEAIQSSMLGIIIIYGDTEWVHSDNFFWYDPCGISVNTDSFTPLLPINLRSSNTDYTISDQVRLANGTALVCTVAGTSGVSDPIVSNKYVDDIITDGGLSWKIIDNSYPKDYRKNSTNYTKGDIIWWGDETVWECMTTGTTGVTEPTLKDLPLNSILVANASTSLIKKIPFDLTIPAWTPKTKKLLNDKVNIRGTTWQYVSSWHGGYSSGDTEPSITNLHKTFLLTDGTVTWKKYNSDKNRPLATLANVIVEGCTVKNGQIRLYDANIRSVGNKITNGNYIVYGTNVISNNNIIQNTAALKQVKYTLTSGLVCNDIIKGSKVMATISSDRKNPIKRLVEGIVLENSTYASEGILSNSSIIMTDKMSIPFLAQGDTRSLKMIGGKITAYLKPSVTFLDPWHSNINLTNVLIDLIVSPGARFLYNHAKAVEGYFITINNCLFKIIPLDHITLMGVGYNDANMKLLNNKFLNLDYTKSIMIDLPLIDTINTVNRNNFFDVNYYSSDINCANNIGGYGAKTTTESVGIPLIGSYALGTKVINVAPTLGVPTSWIATTAGVAFSTTRANSTAYKIGTFAKWPTGNNIYECIVDGITATTPPSISNTDTIIDGTVTWLYRGNTTVVFTSERILL